MSLISLAQKNNLPEHQFMDTATIEWIVKNMPSFENKRKNIVLSTDEVNLVKKYIPPQDWFLDEKRFNSIHGIKHSLRVAIYALKLQKKVNLSLIIAAILHDTRRLNDKNDPHHGRRAAFWFLNNVPKITDKFNINLSKYDIKKIHDIILYHDVPFDDINSDIFNCVNILKTADALDRYCQPKLKWWIRDDFLVFKPTEDMKFFSYNLVVESERIAISGVDNIESVFYAIKKL